jgi:transposase-like protein
MMKCNFCGKETERVFRVALAGEYDRLSVSHKVKWACVDCHLARNRELNERYGLDLPVTEAALKDEEA